MSANAKVSLVSSDVALFDSKFDYGTLSPSVERFLRGQAERIRRQCATSIIQIGKALVEAKRHLSHGAFLRWVESEVGVPSRTAQAYMRAAQWAAGKSATVAHLPASAIYMLSSNGVPEKFVLDVLERVEAGEQIGAAAIRQELRVFLQVRNEKESDGVIEHEKPLINREEMCSPIAELATILARALSEMDFARVCQIFTSDSVLSDPALGEKLERQFRIASEAGMAFA